MKAISGLDSRIRRLGLEPTLVNLMQLRTSTAHFTSSEPVDLTLLIGAMNVWNRFAVAFRRQPVQRSLEAFRQAPVSAVA